MAGATGVPFLPGNRVDILNNGDAFYPAMLDAIAEAEVSITIEAYIYWAGEIGLAVRARRSRRRPKPGVAVKILLDAVGSSTIGDEILEMLEAGPASWPGTTRFAGTRSAASTTARIASR